MTPLRGLSMSAMKKNDIATIEGNGQQQEPLTP